MNFNRPYPKLRESIRVPFLFDLTLDIMKVAINLLPYSDKQVYNLHAYYPNNSHGQESYIWAAQSTWSIYQTKKYLLLILLSEHQ